MDRKGTNELISGEKSFIAMLSNLRVYFVVRLPDYLFVPQKRRVYKPERHAAIRGGGGGSNTSQRVSRPDNGDKNLCYLHK